MIIIEVCEIRGKCPVHKVGDKIIFSKYAGTEIKIEGEEHLIMREDDILGVIEE